ncbi:MAG: hypothetical protein LBE80_06755 [Deltaproteobacteria bacterium]|jgi:hypothetical protein|nr:hypothetical protein [Deltaproteobacteria bacterium]
MKLKTTSICLFALVLFFSLGFVRLGRAANQITYSTQDNPKTNGVVFSVNYPADYEFVDNPSYPSQLFVAYTNEPEFPTVMGVIINPVPESLPEFSFKDFDEEMVTKWVNDSLAVPGTNPQILKKLKTSHKGHDVIRASGMVDQVLLDEIQPSIEELLFVTYKNLNITLVCTVFNSQKNLNILKHFYDRGGFQPCNDFFSSLTLP